MLQSVKSAVFGAPTKRLTAKEQQDRAKAKAYQAELPTILDDLALMEKEAEAIRARVHNGELTMEALRRQGEKMNILRGKIDWMNHYGNQILLDTCTDPKLLAERQQLIRKKIAAGQRFNAAKNSVENLKEEVHRWKGEYERQEAGGVPKHELEQAAGRVAGLEHDLAEAEADYAENKKAFDEIQAKLDINRAAMKAS